MSKKNSTLVIGGNSSFGISVVKELILQKHDVLATHFSKLDRGFIKNASSLVWHRLDVCNEQQIEDLISNSLNKFNNLVYSVSAPLQFKKVDDLTWSDLDNQVQVQVRGLWFLIKTLIKYKHPLRSIVVVGSTCLFGKPPSRLTDYIVAKHALWGLVKSLATELAKSEIRVNLVSPGLSDGGLSSVYPANFVTLVQSSTPMRRLVQGRDVANLVSFLLSDNATYLTGLNIPVDGGLSII